MNEKAHRSYTELEVWKKAGTFKNEVKELTDSFPAHEKFRQLIKLYVHQGE